ncbi:hypothetical protein [Brevundimonas sp.]|uniref:hypothetical protein n=1 Tax=Brevundimonas sp. TaxID=1871086 RepID=UPI0037C064F2
MAIGAALIGTVVLLVFLRSHLNSRLRGRVESVLAVVVLVGLAWGVGHSILQHDWAKLTVFLVIALCTGWGVFRAQRRNKMLTRDRDRLRSAK